MAQNQEQNQKTKIEKGRLFVDQEFIEPLKMLMDKGRAVHYRALGDKLTSAAIYFINGTIVVKAAISIDGNEYILWFKYVHSLIDSAIEFIWRSGSHEITVKEGKDGSKEMQGRVIEMCALQGEARSCINLMNYAETLYRKAINDLRLY